MITEGAMALGFFLETDGIWKMEPLSDESAEMRTHMTRM
jgi:hypothetical protein